MNILNYLIYSLGFGAFGLLIYIAIPLYRKGDELSIGNQVLRMTALGITLALLLVFFSDDHDSWDAYMSPYMFFLPITGVVSLLVLRLTQKLNRYVKRFDIQQLLEYVSINVSTVLGFLMVNIGSHFILGEDLVWQTSGLSAWFIWMDLYLLLVAANVVAFMRLLSNFQVMGDRIQIAETKQEMEQLKSVADRARLQSIQARLNPHFLYNALNSLASQIQANPAGAEQMCLDLARMFRELLDRQGEGPVSVHEAIELVRTYLNIEKARFGDDLHFSISITPDASSYKLPRFLLQPLVENAVLHGRPKDGSAVEVSVDARVTHGCLMVTVIDNGEAFPDPIPGGFGLQSVSETLELLYPNSYSITFNNPPDKSVVLKLERENPKS